jgi:hypothetical protein
MRLLVPRFPAKRIPAMLRIAALGALVAGMYGALHDQVSYAISPEYFTKMKFRQFAWADAGWPPRASASVIGFLGTWWVGLFAGWFLARAGLAEIPRPARRKCVLRSFGIVFVTALLAGVVGALIGLAVAHSDGLGNWRDAEKVLNLEDTRAFVVVAYLHGAGYLGALAGAALAIWYVRKALARARSDAAEPVTP